jgi:predicted extracellular nuclease
LKRLLLAGLLAGCGAGTGTVVPDAGPADAGPVGVPAQVATYNVRRFFDTVCQSHSCAPGDYEELPSTADFNARADQIATAIRGLDVQLVMLEEVETQACVDALETRLSDILPNAVLGETGGAASVDVAILSAWPITEVVKHQATEALIRPNNTLTSFSREFLEVHLDSPGGPVIAFAAHFRSKVSDDPGRRLAEAQKAHEIMLKVAEAHPEAMVILGGDLNDTPGSDPLNALESDGLLLRTDSDISNAATIQYQGRGEAIDHVYLVKSSPGTYQAASAKVFHGAPDWGYGGSDHAAMRVKLQVGVTAPQ